MNQSNINKMKNHAENSFIAWVLGRIKPGKEFGEKLLVNSAIMVTLAAFLVMVTGCSYYGAITRFNDGSVNLLTETIDKPYPEEEYPRDRYPEPYLNRLFINCDV